MVQGPPGTGKSTTLAEILGQLVTRDKNVTVLVCSHSNHGVDNLLLKTLPYLESVPDLAIARVGLYDRVNPLARPHFVPPGEDLGAYNVVFTTVDALALQVEAGGRTYDYAVLDEANRASILDSLIPLVRGRRFILVGDHLQLQPVLSEAEEALRLEPAVGNNSAIGKSLFAWLRERRFPEAATIFLDEQNRMHPVIAGLISEVFYEGKLRSGRRAPRRVADVPLFPAAVTWVDTRGLHGLREARGRGASLVNVPEARLVATIARHILSSSSREVDVGVISAYAEQTALLRRLLLHRNNQRQNGANGANARNPNTLDRAALKHLEIDTVDAFEGREKDIIVVSLVRSNRRRDIGFLRLMQRINVALSRARTMLIIVGDTSTLRGSYFDRIVRYIRANGMLVPGPRLIGRLLNARGIERPGADRQGERPGLPGRRRRPLPSARTAFPLQDPAAATGAGAAAGEEGESQRSRRRRRRVRGRSGSESPGADRRGAPPAVTMEMAPAGDERGNDEPATQYEIDRFAALVEQLLGEGSSDEAAAGPEAPAASEVDRAHAEEVLADALRAVGQQADRTGSSRSRRGNNRRRSRRGQGRPLPGDAAVADAARRMAREEQLAGAPAVPPGFELPDDLSASVGEPAEAAPAHAFRPADEAPAPQAPPARPAYTFEPFDAAPPAAPAPVEPAAAADAAPPSDAVPVAPRRTRRRAAAAADAVEPVVGGPELAAGVPEPVVPVRRTRRRVAAAADAPAAPAVETQADSTIQAPTPASAPPSPLASPALDAPAPSPSPMPESQTPVETAAPARRSRRRTAVAAGDGSAPASAPPVPAEAPLSASEPPAPAPRVRRPRAAKAAASVPAQAEAAGAAPTPSTDATSAPAATSAESPAPVEPAAPAPKSRRTRAASVPAAPPATDGVAAPAEDAPAPKPRRTRRRGTEESSDANPASSAVITPPSTEADTAATARPRRTRRVALTAATLDTPPDD
jgi:hypothetical protein